MQTVTTTRDILDDIGQLSFSKNLDEFLDSIIKVFSHIEDIQSIRIDFYLSVFGYARKKDYVYNKENSNGKAVVIKLDDGAGTLGSLTLTISSTKGLDKFPVLMTLTPTVIRERYKSFWLSSLLNTITSPISFNSSEEEFISEITELLADASGARIIIIRDYLPSEFACKGYYDSNNPKITLRLPSLTKINNEVAYNYLNNFIKDSREENYRKIQVIHQNSPELDMVKDLLSENEIKSVLTVPMMKGEECGGIISFIFEAQIFESSFIEEAFLLLGNHTAVSIENYRKSMENANLQANGTRDFIEKINFEIMQGLRHAAINNISKLRGQLDSLKGVEKKELDDIKQSCRDVTKDLEGMRSLTSKYDQEKYIISITECFREATNILSNRIKPMDIKVKIGNQDEFILGVKPAITYAFVNVILNSIDSFKDGYKSAFKTINFNIVDQNEDSVAFHISDNGLGFKPKGSVHSTEQIWDPGVTTRKNGTGYGLPMVREVFQSIHRGTVKVMPTTGFTLRFEIFRYKSNSEKIRYEELLKKKRK